MIYKFCFRNREGNLLYGIESKKNAWKNDHINQNSYIAGSRYMKPFWMGKLHIGHWHRDSINNILTSEVTEYKFILCDFSEHFKDAELTCKYEIYLAKS